MRIQFTLYSLALSIANIAEYRKKSNKIGPIGLRRKLD
jgi:hypothetical protein